MELVPKAKTKNHVCCLKLPLEGSAILIDPFCTRTAGSLLGGFRQSDARAAKSNEELVNSCFRS